MGREMSEAAKGGALDRRGAVASLLRDRGELLVVTGLGSPTYDVFAAGDHSGNFYLWGAMGGAALVGLGIAQAQPDRPVAVFTGDGEQLMGLGGLATIAVGGARNLSIVVLDNGHFGETGGQLSHSGLGVDLCAVARAVGFPVVETVSDAAGLEKARLAIGQVSAGPRFILVRIANGETERALPMRDGSAIKTRFRAHLGLEAS
jgi:thiamine pyrophosphate-dependent acetolactate synthase large subunit-like protein